MRVTEGIRLVLTPTQRFDELVAFFRDVMGLGIEDHGVPATDTQFTRYAAIQMPGGVTLEIVEPKDDVARLYTAPTVSMTVDDVAAAREMLVSRRIECLTAIFDTRQGWGWTYFRAPDGTVCQLQGPYPSVEGVRS